MTPEKALEILRLAAQKIADMTKPGEIRQNKTLENLDEVCRWIWEIRQGAASRDAWMAEHYLRIATFPDYHPPQRAPKPATTGSLRRPGDVMVVGLNGADYLLILDHQLTTRCFVSDAGRLREIQFPGETLVGIG